MDSTALSVENLVALVSTIGALGAASTGIVNAVVKGTRLDLAGIGAIWSLLGSDKAKKELVMAVLKEAYGHNARSLVEGMYRKGGAPLQAALMNALRLTVEQLPALSEALGRPRAAAAQERILADAAAATSVDKNAVGRLEVSLVAHTEAAIATAEAIHARAMKAYAATVSVVSGGVGGWLHDGSLRGIAIGCAAGALAIPVSPVVHDLVSLIQSAKNLFAARQR